MPRIYQQFSVPSEGTGRPDFSQQIDDIAKGYTYPSFWPARNERWKIFLASYPQGSELTAGASAKFVDVETNLPTPYYSPVGWYVRFGSTKCTFNQIIQVVLRFFWEDPILAYLKPFTFCPPVQDVFVHNEQLAYLDTRYWDPLAEDPHNIDLTITNTSGSDAVGFAEVALIMEEVGTPKMTEKRVKCPYCEYINTVRIEKIKITCGGCREMFAVPYFGKKII